MLAAGARIATRGTRELIMEARATYRRADRVRSKLCRSACRPGVCRDCGSRQRLAVGSAQALLEVKEMGSAVRSNWTIRSR